MLPTGKHGIIRIYRSGLIRKTGHKITFDLYDEPTASYSQKCFAYTDVKVASELHRQHCYRVSLTTILSTQSSSALSKRSIASRSTRLALHHPD